MRRFSPRRKRPTLVAVFAVLVLVLSGGPLAAHDIYLMNSNHTDYAWNATPAESDAAILADLDYYLQQIAATASAPSNEQARFDPDCWWWVYLYEQNRPADQFAKLIDAMRSGHITVPLNPFVTLYGALPTEAAIRASYYPGRIARRYHLEFPLVEYRENHTIPWGLASIWSGCGASYTWKGVCGCFRSAPPRTDAELFVWQGPDGKTLLFKWYNLLYTNRDWGGYAEARDNLSSPEQLDAAIARSKSRMPGIPVTGLFGAGWDDVSWQTSAVRDAVVAYNATDTGDRAVMSNGVDFFRALEASGAAADLPTLRGGWGNDWDMWPASLAERTSRGRRALERLRTAEALSAWAELEQPGFWPPVRESLEQGLIATWKYFEHSWSVVDGGPSLAELAAFKGDRIQDLENAIGGAIATADATVSGLFETPDEDRVAVFNPLGFERTDVVEFEVSGPGPYVVTDVESGAEVPSQMVSEDGTTRLRFLAGAVPSLGYRVYRYEPGTSSSWAPAATVTAASRTIENDRYRVVAGNRGQILHAFDKLSEPEVDLAGGKGLNDFESSTIQSVTASDVGAVSATLEVQLSGPSRTVRITLYRGVDRIDIDDTIDENQVGYRGYTFDAGLAGSQIRFEEVGAIARPGLVHDGGDFLPGTRANRMTLNHFVDFALPGYQLVLSNWDAYAMQVNDSTTDSFDLTDDTVHVVAMEQALGAGFGDQGGDSFFRNRFALRALDGPYDGAEAMRTALAHQNPLHAIPLPRSQHGPLTAPTAGLLSIDADNAVVTAFKPAEDDNAGFVVRLWELAGTTTTVHIDASALQPIAAWNTSLVESDLSSARLTGGVISKSIDANEISTCRIVSGTTTPRVRRATHRVPPG